MIIAGEESDHEGRYGTPHLWDPLTCGGDHCHEHGVCELRKSAYMSCSECGHVYPTVKALVAAGLAHLLVIAAELREPDEVTGVLENGLNPSEIPSCPFCDAPF